jgi:hypothetical protein
MANDLMFVIGLLFVLLAAPATVSAFAESRAPRMAAVLFIVGGALISLAMSRNPGGYAFDQIPRIIMRVVSGGSPAE